MPADFDLLRVEDGIVGTRFSGHLVHFRSVGSTNQLANEAALSGSSAGVWIADEQTAGRGRGGHNWHSPADSGLYVSVLVKTPIPLRRAGMLALISGLAAQAAILECTGLTADIRWPNDLMFADRKCGGILIESASEAANAAAAEARLRHAVIGIGINVNHVSFPRELGALATSLAMESGRSFRREVLLASLLRHLEDQLDRTCWGSEDALEVTRRYSRASTWVEGKRVSVDEAGGFIGVTRGLDEHGFLLVEDDAGAIHTVFSGGVRSA